MQYYNNPYIFFWLYVFDLRFFSFQNEIEYIVCILSWIGVWRLSFQEKEDLEAQFRDVNERAERASSQQSALQQELERMRQQANEALKAMDVERQQLRSANNKYRLQITSN